MRLAVVLLCIGCGTQSVAPTKRPTASASAGSTAHAFLQCIGRSGSECVQPHPAGDGWAALGDLYAVELTPAPLLAAELYAAVKRLHGQEGYRRLLQSTLAAAKRAHDLSCKITRVEDAGARLLASRDKLVRDAERMGLGSTRAGPRVGKLAATIDPMAGTKLVTARCHAGDVFVLVSPPSTPLDPDEDPRAHPGAGWRAYAAGIDKATLVRGGVLLPARVPELRDPARPGIDPWIPLTELEL